MTAIAVAYNKNGIAIAADSAATTILNGKAKIFNANKIFRLSENNQVGIGVYQSSEFGGLPIEVICKEYRKQLKKKEFPDFKNYVDDFLVYLNKSNFIKDSDPIDLFFRFLQLFQNERNQRLGKIQFEASGPLSLEESQKQLGIFIKELSGNINQNTKLKTFKTSKQGIKIEDSVFSLLDIEKDKIKSLLEQENANNLIPVLEDIINLFQLYFTTNQEIWNYSGLVFFGYGKNDMTPKIFHTIIRAKIRNEILLDKYEDQVGRFGTNVLGYADNKVIFNSVWGFNPDLQDKILNQIASFGQKTGKDYNDVIKIRL